MCNLSYVLGGRQRTSFQASHSKAGYVSRDPLSPYLYLICGEALTKASYAEDVILKVGSFFPNGTPGSDRILILQYADTTFISVKAFQACAKLVGEVLHLYGEKGGSGLT